MPIEIKELHIKINVEEKANVSDSKTETKKEETNKIIEACIEQVMENISKIQDR